MSPTVKTVRIPSSQKEQPLKTAASYLFRLSIFVIILESRHLHTPDEADVHEFHPVLKEKLSQDDKCWKTEQFEVVKECDLCSGKALTLSRLI